MLLLPVAASQGVRFETVTEETVGHLAQFASEIHPEHFISELDVEERSEMYGRWLRGAPRFAMLITQTTERRRQVIGCTILLPITRDARAGFRGAFRGVRGARRARLRGTHQDRSRHVSR